MTEPPLDLESRIVGAIRQIIRAVDVHSRRLHDECGLTGPQLATLQAAARLEPVTAGALSRAVRLSQATVTGILARLERRSLVARARETDDKRVVVVRVTAEGRELLGRAPSLLQDRVRRELERLDEWERLAILSNLQRLATMMGADEIEALPHFESIDDE